MLGHDNVKIKDSSRFLDKGGCDGRISLSLRKSWILSRLCKTPGILFFSICIILFFLPLQSWESPSHCSEQDRPMKPGISRNCETPWHRKVKASSETCLRWPSCGLGRKKQKETDEQKNPALLKRTTSFQPTSSESQAAGSPAFSHFLFFFFLTTVMIGFTGSSLW